MSYILIDDLCKRFGSADVLRHVTLPVEKGKLVTLLGPSGCGKSTLLRILAGLEAPTSGRVWLDGEDITHREPGKRSIGMVFQQYSLFPNLTAAENVAFGLKLKRAYSKEEIRARVTRALETVELEGRERAMPADLSGGQQQRVALARALVTEPKILLLDEPLSAIDAKLRKALQLQIKEIQRALGITVIFVTHDQDEAMLMSDVIHLFSEGQIEQSGRPTELYTSPRTRFTASFIGHYNILTAEAFQAVTGEARPDARDVAIRPEAVDILPAPPPEAPEGSYLLEGTVTGVVPHGNVLRYGVAVGGQVLQADVLFRSFRLYEPGQPVFLTLERRNCLPVD